MTLVYRPENQPDFPTAEDYVLACDESFERYAMIPWPTSHAELMALDKSHPPTDLSSGWADSFGGFVPDEWYSHRPPPLPPIQPPPPELDDSEKSRFLNSLLMDDVFRLAVQQILEGR